MANGPGRWKRRRELDHSEAHHVRLVLVAGHRFLYWSYCAGGYEDRHGEFPQARTNTDCSRRSLVESGLVHWIGPNELTTHKPLKPGWDSLFGELINSDQTAAWPFRDNRNS